MASVKDKITIITGGSKGIGAATARLFAEEGSKVVVVAQDRGGIDRMVEEIKDSGGTIFGMQADVRNSEQVNGMVAQVIEEFGGVDILINNAGILSKKYFLDQTEEERNAAGKSG